MIAPSPPGYCDTEAPLPREYYTFKRIAKDLTSLLSALGVSKAIYIGHDWGSVIVQRIALWYPERVLAVGVICVPFLRVQSKFIPVKELVKISPTLTYQMWLTSPDCERTLSNPDMIQKFLKVAFSIRGDTHSNWNSGTNFLETYNEPPVGQLWEQEDPAVWQYYLSCFQKKGSLRGPLTYYKTRDLNYRDELEIVDTARIQCPAMFIGAAKDMACPPHTWGRQEWVSQLERYAVRGGHWCLVENEGKEIAPIIQGWIARVSRTSKL